ncbi:MAG: glutaredoxin family protein [Acidobacteria bacterium]|nr:glutaredoxin family protein [Acidobacteriota bacterium]
MKEFLSRTGSAFTVRVVDEDPHAYDDLVALGYRSVPVTVIGGTIVKGFDPEALATALAAVG